MYKNIARVYGPHTTYNEYYVQRVTKEIVRNDDDEDAIWVAKKNGVKEKRSCREENPVEKERKMPPTPLSIWYIHTHIYIYPYIYIYI